MDVPFKVLEHKYHFSDKLGEISDELKVKDDQTTPNSKLIAQNSQRLTPNSSGAIIHGDNLEALKSLLPEYEGKIKCIYIDPPYNTGNEGWVYNDNVNDPKIKKWLEKVVGKEGEDLSRHDKWLCMMYPRLKLLHKLLAEDGAIFISIDDNEQGHLRLMCDEIFGGGNFINNIIWQKKFSPQNDARYLSDMHDFIVCYTKNKSIWNRNLLPRSIEQNERYKNPDNDLRGPWTSSDLSVKTYNANTDYEIITPNGTKVRPSKSRCWSVSKGKFQELVNDNRIWFGKTESNVPRLKKFFSEVNDGIVPVTIWFHTEVSHNQGAKQEIKSIVDNVNFDTPKPSRLIERILKIATNKEDIILDSFAGSGTTAHAVLNLNKQDGGNRKFICIEMEDYAETITAERVKHVIKGYGKDKKAVEGTGGSFDFYELGEPFFDEEGNLNESVGLAKIRNYVWYTETKSPLVEETHQDNIHFLGKHLDTGFYFNYEAQAVTTLDHTFLASMKTKAEQYVIYADNCLLTKTFMVKHHIVFKKIPRDITRF